MSSSPRLIVLANRLPVRRARRAAGASSPGVPEWVVSSGGLVSALEPALQARRGIWIGWAGGADDAPAPFERAGIEHRAVTLSTAEHGAFYEGFCNSTLWPLYHDAIRPPIFERSWWAPYVDVNRRYARAAAEATGPGDVCWIHDYHLQLAPAFVRELQPKARIGFFLHIPFPPSELFAQLPWRTQLAEGLLGADVIGFQTRGGAQNFLRCVRRHTDAQVAGKVVRFRGREVFVDAFPISIDFARFSELAQSEPVRRRTQRLRQKLGEQRKILLGVDRLDYTKGIDARLEAFEGLLQARRATKDQLAFVQIAVPSRESVESYAEMREDIEQRVGRINGNFGETGLMPVHYLYRSLPTEELVSYYLLADVMVVTPMRDGMNLVAKEYVAARNDSTGVLVLSEFTGAAQDLTSALLVNPHDVDGVAATLARALDLAPTEAVQRMGRMRRHLQKNDVHRWAESFLNTLG